MNNVVIDSELLKLQDKAEERSVLKGISVMTKAQGVHLKGTSTAQDVAFKHIAKYTVITLAERIQEEVARLTKSKRCVNRKALLLLAHLHKDHYVTASITLGTIGRLLSFGTTQYSKVTGLHSDPLHASVANSIGNSLAEEALNNELKIEDRSGLNAIARRAKKLFTKITKDGKRISIGQQKGQMIRKLNKEVGVDLKHVTKEVRLATGFLMLDILSTLRPAKDALIQFPSPIIQHVTVRRQKHTCKAIKFTQVVLDQIQKDEAYAALMRPEQEAMRCLPLRWTQNNYRSGGYRFQQKGTLELMSSRGYSVETQKEITARLAKAQPVLDVVNEIQETAWRINQKVYDVMLEVGSSRVASTYGLPSLEDLEYPNYEEIPDDRSHLTDDEVKALFIARGEAITTWDTACRLNTIARRNFETLMAKARSYINDGVAIYFPHVLDWRGRIYSKGIPLHPQSTDLAKGLLMFDKGKPLGERGAYWLAVHMANCFGYDKVEQDEQVEWINDNAELIMDCAENPYDVRWWCEADKPYMFLAGCFEFLGYQQNGDEHLCHLPTSVDGTCNGLQHLSVVARHRASAQSVNVLPGNRQDMYSRVLKELEPEIQSLARSNQQTVEQAKQAWLKIHGQDDSVKALRTQEDIDNLTLLSDTFSAKALISRDWVKRSLVKRPVMTLCYASTEQGQQRQIIEELEGYNAELPMSMRHTHKEIWAMSLYVRRLCSDAMNKVVAGTNEIMNYLQTVTSLVLDDTVSPLLWWTTHHGLPVVQSYQGSTSKQIRTAMGGAACRVRIREGTNIADKRKHTRAIAANWTHSLDASHLTETVRIGKERGVTSWAMVHDSFGCHPCDVDALGVAIREAFINIHRDSVPLLSFRREMMMQCTTAEVKRTIEELELPQYATEEEFGLDKVMDSQYFFA